MRSREKRQQAQQAPALRQQKQPKDQLPTRHPWDSPPWEEGDCGALKAVFAGTASPDQQRRAMEYIVHVACATYDWPYRPDGDRDTCIAINALGAPATTAAGVYNGQIQLADR